MQPESKKTTVSIGLVQPVVMADFIYRIQDSDGRGPFKPGFSHVWVNERGDHENLKPCTQQFDGIRNKLLLSEHYGCGCKNLKQLRRWFTKQEYKKLKKYGYRAVKMKVARIVAESEIQVVFGRAIPLNENIDEIRLY